MKNFHAKSKFYPIKQRGEWLNWWLFNIVCHVQNLQGYDFNCQSANAENKVS